MVSTNRLVETSITVLRLLSDKNLYVNEIIQQTSSDRGYVIEVIKKLEDAELVTGYKTPEHKQKKIKRLTELGRELIDMLDSLEQYKRAYFELEKPVNEYFDNWRQRTQRGFGEQQKGDAAVRTRDNILRERGFTAEDLEFYEESDRATTNVLGSFINNVLEIIIVRCALRLYKFNLNNIAKDILNNIFVNAVSFRLSVQTGEMDRISALSNRGMNQEIQDYINTYHDYDEDLIDDMQIQQYIPAVIYKEVKNAILAYLSLLRPPKESVYDIYQGIKSNFEKPKPPLPKEMTKEERLQRKQLQSILKLPKPTKEQKKMREERLLNLPKRVKCLLDVYETYMSRSN